MNFKTLKIEAGEMIQWLRVLAEYPSFIPNTYMVAYNI